MNIGLGRVRNASLRRGVASVVALAVAYFVANAFMRNGVPSGIVVQGVVIGGLDSLIAMGLILIYRSIRVINFSQAALGGLASALSILLVTGSHWSYWVAVPIGIAAAVVTGFLCDLLIQWRFAASPRLIVTVATIGIAEVLGLAALELPHLFTSHLSPLSTFKTPFTFKFYVNPLYFSGDALVAMIVVPIALAALYWFFIKTDIGVAIRGAADSRERAQLLGIPVRNLSRITWMVAAGLSGVGTVLTQPISGANLGTFDLSGQMIVPLAAFVLAGMESLPMAVLWSLGIGIIEQAVFYSYGTYVYAEVVLFVLIVVGLIFQRTRQLRVTGAQLGEYVAVREVAEIPRALARLKEVRIGKAMMVVVLLGLAVAFPLISSRSLLSDGVYAGVYAIIAVSMVMLTGWAGQISLGQFGFAGIGAALAGAFMVHLNVPFLLAFVVAGLAGGVLAVVIGIPALRLEGTALAVVTLAFAVVMSDYVLSSQFFPWLDPQPIAAPVLLKRFPLGPPYTWLYEFALVVLVASILVARNLRRSRVARTIMSVRDNSRAASAYGISPLKSKLLAFGLSGFIAGIAGAIYVVFEGGISSNGFSASMSVNVFIMVVIGGLGSISGGVLGALYLTIVSTALSSNLQYLGTGAGVLLVLIIFPEGLGGVVFKVRDWVVAQIARSKGLSPDGATLATAGNVATADAGQPSATGGPAGSRLAHTAALRLGALEDLEVQRSGQGQADAADAGPAGGRPAVVTITDINASYGSSQVLFDVGLGVAQREVVALLGTNGAGKTTVLRTISGMLRPKSGRVGFLGRDVTGLSPVERVHDGLVTVLGGRGIFPSLTVEENLRLAAWTAQRHLKDQGFAKAATERVLALFPVLRSRHNQRAGLLSGGEQQMLALGQALLCRPKLLLIDELSLGLAPTVVADLLEVIRALAASGVTVVVVEQSVNVATAISNRAIFMERGRVRFSGPTPDLSQQPQLLRSVFLHAAERARERKARSLGRGDQFGPVESSSGASAAKPSSDDVLSALTGGLPTNAEPSGMGSEDLSGIAPGIPTGAGAIRVPSPALSTPPSSPHPPSLGFLPNVPANGAHGSSLSAGSAYSVEGVSKHYGGVAALVDVSIQVAPGEILGIIGSNGAGKTTLFDVCSGFIKPDHGRVTMGGVDITNLSPAQRANRGLGRAFQDARLWPSMTVEDALATSLEQDSPLHDPVAFAIGLTAAARSEAEVFIRVEELIAEMGLARFRDRFISELSTGTRRIVELACAVSTKPDVLLLDEPTSGIAQRESEALGELLLGLRDQTGSGFIVIEHDVPLVSSIADRMVCMHLGEVIAEGETTSVLANPAVVSAYLGADAAAAQRSGPMPAGAGSRAV